MQVFATSEQENPDTERGLNLAVVKRTTVQVD
jgi:hypothetical protein